MSEIGVPWWFRTLRNTSSSKTATGNTFWGFRKLVNNSLSTLPEGSPLVSRLKSARSPSGRPTQSHSGEGVVARTVSRQTTRRLYQTQNFDKVVWCFSPVLKALSFPVVVLCCTTVVGVFKTPTGPDFAHFTNLSKKTTIFPK